MFLNLGFKRFFDRPSFVKYTTRRVREIAATIPEHILIPQEKVKKITKKDVDKIDFKKILNEETEEEDD